MSLFRIPRTTYYALVLAFFLACGGSDDGPFIPVGIPNEDITLERIFPGFTFEQPVLVTFANVGVEWIFVVERRGTIQAITDQGSNITFLDLRDRVNSTSQEQGLLGLAFHPQFLDNGYLYVYYINSSGNSTISRFSSSNTIVDANSELVLLEVEQPFANHNAGMLAFGPDNYLYIALGDGGGANDPLNTGQDLTDLLGSILRIDVDNTSAGLPYAIPSDNPFAGNAEGFREEIFAYGLRNPYRFSFDSQTGSLYAGDVGQDAIEEIDLIVNGGNYGWNTMEGSGCFNGSNCDTSGLLLPITEYDHSVGQSVTGGYVYRGEAAPGLQGLYFYADFVSRTLFALDVDSPSLEVRTIPDIGIRISSFGQDESGNLYCADFTTGGIYVIR